MSFVLNVYIGVYIDFIIVKIYFTRCFIVFLTLSKVNLDNKIKNTQVKFKHIYTSFYIKKTFLYVLLYNKLVNLYTSRNIFYSLLYTLFGRLLSSEIR
nr:MAG TPA: hypothetical protein [Caudoviricetes sp.]